jgi:hypothetical protein
MWSKARVEEIYVLQWTEVEGKRPIIRIKSDESMSINEVIFQDESSEGGITSSYNIISSRISIS